MSKQCIQYIDLAKYIPIYLVLWGHVLGSLTSPLISSEILVRVTSKLIHSFHMPLFMFLSGLFASSTLKKETTIPHDWAKRAAIIVAMYNLTVGNHQNQDLAVIRQIIEMRDERRYQFVLFLNINKCLDDFHQE